MSNQTIYGNEIGNANNDDCLKTFPELRISCLILSSSTKLKERIAVSVVLIGCLDFLDKVLPFEMKPQLTLTEILFNIPISSEYRLLTNPFINISLKRCLNALECFNATNPRYFSNGYLETTKCYIFSKIFHKILLS